MVRKISGKSKSASYKHLNTNFSNTKAKDIADTLGSIPPPCCVLEQDTLLPESTG